MKLESRKCRKMWKPRRTRSGRLSGQADEQILQADHLETGKIEQNQKYTFIYLHLPLWWRFHPRKGTCQHCSWEENELTGINRPKKLSQRFVYCSFLLAVFFATVWVSDGYHCNSHPHLFTYYWSLQEIPNWELLQNIKTWLHLFQAIQIQLINTNNK